MILREVFPETGTLHELQDNPTETLVSLYPIVSGFRFNYVTSAEVTKPESNLATNSLDRLILKHIRAQSDLIITTGLTARNEKLNSSQFAPMLVITRANETLNFPATQTRSSHPVYLTQTLGTEYPNTKAIAIGIVRSSIPDFASAFCRDNSILRAVVETGITAAREFAHAGLLTEIDLTVTRSPEQEVASRLAKEFLTALGITDAHMIQLLKHEDSWFFRFGSPAARNL